MFPRIGQSFARPGPSRAPGIPGLVPLTSLGVYLFSVLPLPFALVGVIAFPVFWIGDPLLPLPFTFVDLHALPVFRVALTFTPRHQKVPSSSAVKGEQWENGHDDMGSQGRVLLRLKLEIGPPDGVVNPRLGQQVGRPPVGLAGKLGQQHAFAFLIPQHRGEREALGRDRGLGEVKAAAAQSNDALGPLQSGHRGLSAILRTDPDCTYAL
jgi:hypothetical protein